MQRIFLTGGSGFVGTNLQAYLSTNFQFSLYAKGEIPIVKDDIVIHLAGKAHDTKQVAEPEAYYQVNTELTKKIFDAFLLVANRIHLIVLPSFDKLNSILVLFTYSISK